MVFNKLTLMKSDRRFLVGGNWKLNGDRLLIQQLVSETLVALPNGSSIRLYTYTPYITMHGVDSQIVVAPQFPYLSLLKNAAETAGLPIEVAAQNVSLERRGAFTGEVSVDALADLQIPWCIVGHSERRTLFCETNEVSIRGTRTVDTL